MQRFCKSKNAVGFQYSELVGTWEDNESKVGRFRVDSVRARVEKEKSCDHVSCLL